MRHNLFFVISFFALTTLFIFSLSILSLHYQFSAMGGKISYAYEVSKNTNFRALPDSNDSIAVSIPEVDVRIEAMQKFLDRHKSPLANHAVKLIEVADKNSLDYRLLPSIAMQESNLCKKTVKAAPYICWGFGIYGTKRTGFDSYDQAIEQVAKTLSEKYIAYGYTTPEEIMKKYTPGSNGSWAKGVYYFMDQIDYYTN